MAQGLNPLPGLKSRDSNRAQPVTVASLLPLIAALGTSGLQPRRYDPFGPAETVYAYLEQAPITYAVI